MRSEFLRCFVNDSRSACGIELVVPAVFVAEDMIVEYLRVESLALRLKAILSVVT